MKCAHLLFAGFLLLLAACGCEKQNAIPDSPAPVAAKEDPELSAYSKKLAPILASRILANRKWEDALKAVPAKELENGLGALAIPTDEYAQAIEKGERDLKGITPPASAKAIHECFIRLFSRLGANLDATVAAMRADADVNPATLSSERRQITQEGEANLNLALAKGGFDIDLFNRTGELKIVR